MNISNLCKILILLYVGIFSISSFSQSNPLVFKGQGYQFQLLTSGNAHYLKFKGQFKYPSKKSAQRKFLMPITQVILNLKSNAKVFLFVTSASGGDVIVHKKVMQWLGASGRHVTTFISGICQSACLDLATRADFSYAVQSKAKIYVHRGAFYEDGAVLTLTEIANYYDRMGANGRWILENPQYYTKDNRLRTIPLTGAVQLRAIDHIVSKEYLIKKFGQSLTNWVF